MRAVDLFPTTVMEFDFRNFNKKAELIDYINSILNNSSHGLVENGLHTRQDINVLDHVDFSSFKRDVQECLSIYADSIGCLVPVITESWAIVMDHRGQTGSHIHECSTLSGVYYPLLEDNTCNLVFTTPLETHLMNFLVSDPSKDYLMKKSFIMNVKQDFLYIFPSYLKHETQINKGNKRIAVSFNSMIKT